MGVVNVTPDSFSDGGRFLDPRAAVEHGRRLVDEGAQILDVGGESTRPGADAVPAEEELRRVVPVVEGLAAGRRARSRSTRPRPSVAAAALDAGADYVNDVTAFRGDPELAGLVAERGVDCCLMHMLGTPRTMQDDPRYDDVVADVKAFLERAARVRRRRGHRRGADRCSTPGSASARRSSTTSSCSRRLGEIVALGRPGRDRRSRASRSWARSPAATRPSRAVATAAANVLALERGASVFRVHDVPETLDALAVAAATLAGGWPLTTRGLRRRRPDRGRRRRTGRSRGRRHDRDRRSLALHPPRRHRRPSARSASGSSSTSASTSASRTRSSPTASRTRSTTARSAR